MSEDKKKVPKLRFPEFEGEWEEKPLKELCSVYDGTHRTPNYTQKGVMFLSVEDIKTLHSEKYISYSDFEKEFRVFPQRGDILMTRIGDIGTANVVESDEPIAYYVSLALIKNGQIDSYFLKGSIATETVQRDIWKRTLHIAFPQKINMNEVANILISFPKCAKEQKAIGMFLRLIEQYIELQQKKLDDLKKLRESLLQKVFPQSRRQVPQVRFPEFKGEWKYCKLRDIAEIVGGGTPNTKVKKYWDGDIDWYTPTEIKGKRYVNNSTKKITRNGLEKSSAKLLPGGRTILFTSRASVGDMAILRHSGATNQGFQSLVLRDGYDPYFVYASGIKIKRFAVRNAAGSTFPEISAKQLGNMDYQVPTYEEQQSIGGLMRKIDDLITAHQNKLNHFEKLKKGLLQQMFI